MNARSAHTTLAVFQILIGLLLAQLLLAVRNFSKFLGAARLAKPPLIVYLRQFNMTWMQPMINMCFTMILWHVFLLHYRGLVAMAKESNAL